MISVTISYLTWEMQITIKLNDQIIVPTIIYILYVLLQLKSWISLTPCLREDQSKLSLDLK